MTVSQLTHKTSLLTLLHAIVDGLCACCLFLVEPALGSSMVIALFVVYNVLAFMTQPLSGSWIDRNADQKLPLLIAILLLVSGGFLTLILQSETSAFLFLPIVLLGLGNSLFHVYGGKFVAVHSGNDVRHLGIFVSSGALGLLLGKLQAGNVAIWVMSGMLFLLAFIFLKTADSTYRKNAEKYNNPTICPRSVTNKRWLIVLLIFIVFIRSFVGQLDPFCPHSIPDYAVIAVFVAVIGKILGGFFAQRLGVWRVLLMALLLAGISYLLSYYHAAFVLLLVLFINLTMPLTLSMANSVMPRREGLAFGLLASVLAPGVCLAIMCSDSTMMYLLLFALVSTVVIETVVLLLLKERRWQVLGLSLVINVLTNMPLNLYVNLVLDGEASIGLILLLELIVIAIETAAYQLAVRNIRRSLLYGIVCNMASFLIGLVYGIVFV